LAVWYPGIPPQKKQGLLTLGFNENISHIIILSHLKFPIMVVPHPQTKKRMKELYQTEPVNIQIPGLMDLHPPENVETIGIQPIPNNLTRQ